jgi:flagellin
MGLDNSGGATPLTATAGPGVGAGTFVINGGGFDINIGTGAISVSYDGETFTGNLAAPSPGAFSTTVLTGGTTGHTITLQYKQSTAPAYGSPGLAWDVAGASFDFVASGTAATVSNIAGPTATAGTYTFTSSTGSTLTLTGPGGTQTINVADTAAGTTQTLTFGTLGISFDLVANGLGNFSKASAIGNLVQAGNNTIVVNAGGGGGAGGTVTTGAGSSATFQVGANSGDSLGVSFSDARTSAAGYGSLATSITGFSSATGSGNGIITAASTLISSVDVALNYVSTTRGNFGAVQNRLEHTIASLGVSSENLSASASRIKDLDVAAEMVTFTKTQILQQAGTAILAQANQAPRGILSLLR